MYYLRNQLSSFFFHFQLPHYHWRIPSQISSPHPTAIYPYHRRRQKSTTRRRQHQIENGEFPISFLHFQQHATMITSLSRKQPSLFFSDLPRSNSTTISQLTKDRLKNMIANRSKGESNSQSNLMSNSVTANGNGHDNGRKLKNSNSQVNVSSPHFEPYRLPTSLANAHNLQQASEFQLRKVNSEPNLKMRIRAKLLSKGSSPVQHVQQNNSQFNFTHPQLKRLVFKL